MIKQTIKPGIFCEVCETELKPEEIHEVKNLNGNQYHFCRHHYEKLCKELPPVNSENLKILFNPVERLRIGENESRTVKI